MATTFKEILARPELGARFEKVREYFFLRESTYDMTRRCNLRCEGCYYYEGDKQNAVDETDPARWRASWSVWLSTVVISPRRG